VIERFGFGGCGPDAAHLDERAQPEGVSMRARVDVSQNSVGSMPRVIVMRACRELASLLALVGAFELRNDVAPNRTSASAQTVRRGCITGPGPQA